MKQANIVINAILLLMILGTPLHAQDPASLKSIAGKYSTLADPQPTNTGDAIEIIEFFWYGCPHCYSFEPTLEQWEKQKPDYIELIRIPAVLGEHWLHHAKAFYTAKQLGVLDKIHNPLFNAIHAQKRRITDQASLRDFFIEQGVDKKDFDQTYQSEIVDRALKIAYSTSKSYKLTGVPSIIINGKYKTSVSMAGGSEKVIQVINTLAASEHHKQATD